MTCTNPATAVSCGAIVAGTVAGAQTAVMGGSPSDTVKAAGVGFASVHAFSAIGTHYNFAEAPVSNVVLHGFSGGVASVVMGGKFNAGFIGGAAGAAITPFALAQNRGVGALISAIVGGTAEAIAGGKFANGAVTGAFAYAFANAANSSEKGGAQDATLTTDSGQRHINADIDGDGTADITFVNDDPNGLSTDMVVRNELASMVEDVVRSSGFDSINVNSTVRGPCSDSNHCFANAVDINRINGMRVVDPANLQNVTNLQQAYQNHPGIRENFGPVMNLKTLGPNKIVNMMNNSNIVNLHRNHIHASAQW